MLRELKFLIGQRDKVNEWKKVNFKRILTKRTAKPAKIKFIPVYIVLIFIFFKLIHSLNIHKAKIWIKWV